MLSIHDIQEVHFIRTKRVSSLEHKAHALVYLMKELSHDVIYNLLKKAKKNLVLYNLELYETQVHNLV